MSIRSLKGGACAASVVVALCGQAMGQLQGPSSSQTPYLLPVENGVITKSLLTVGDGVKGPNGPYRMAGLPDGLGAFSNGNGTFTLLMNHELGADQGIVRQHGSVGAFVSMWTIDSATHEVLSGQDLIKDVWSWDAAKGQYTQGIATFGRFCSADLPAPTAFYNPDSGLGTQARIFMNGEEAGNEGRAWGHIASGGPVGTTYELPRLGKFSWENSVANPASGDRTLIIGTDDSSPGQVYLYAGTKSDQGNDFDRAGLTNGGLYGIKVDGVPLEDRNAGLGGATLRFGLSNFGDVSGTTGAKLQSDSAAAGVTEFLRPEDGAWDPSNPSDFYFVTTDRFDQVKTGQGDQVGRSRLWRLSFDDLNSPEMGGTIEMLLDGTEDQQMMDNLCIDKFGNVLIQEDPGNQAYNAKIWNYNIATDSLTLLAMHDAARFGDLNTPATPPYNQDEESSGIIDASEILGPGWFLIDDQAHYGLSDPELVQGGQMLAFFSPLSVPAPGSLALLGLGGLIAGRRRR